MKKLIVLTVLSALLMMAASAFAEDEKVRFDEKQKQMLIAMLESKKNLGAAEIEQLRQIEYSPAFCAFLRNICCVASPSLPIQNLCYNWYNIDQCGGCNSTP